MKKIKLKIVLAILGLSTTASLVGSVSGTIAWYAYSTRALISYSGTSVQSTTQLQIGIKSDIEVDFKTNTPLLDHVTFEGDTNHYYFMKVGAGGMPAAIINEYLSAKGYTTNVLEPLSSYTYQTGGNFDLRNRPLTNKPYEPYTAAEKSKYAEIPFVFRILAANTSTSTYIGGQDIFLSGAVAKAASANDGKINESIRLYIDRTASNKSNYILNPSKAQNGKTKVAGVLDLSSDGYYDHDNNANSPTFNNEYIYGEYTVEEGYTEAGLLTDPSVTPASSDIVDLNGEQEGASTLKPTTFTSKHANGVNYFTKESLTHIIPGYAEYLGTDTVFPTKNVQTGDLESQYAVCTTATSGNKLGEFNMKIYLEGWDFSVIDEELTHEFYLGLTFEINVVKDNPSSSSQPSSSAQSSSSSEENNG